MLHVLLGVSQGRRECRSSPLSRAPSSDTLAPGLLSAALAASPCHYKGISVHVNGLFVGTSRTT